MRRKHDVRFRATLVFASFAALMTLFLAIVFWFSVHDLGRRLIDESLTAELDNYFVRRQRNPGAIPPNTMILHGYVQDDEHEELPAYLQSLQPGRHDLQVGDFYYRVAMTDRQGIRYFLLYDMTMQKRREDRIMLLLAAFSMISILLSALVGRWLGGLIIAPMSNLAFLVRTQKNDAWAHPLADHFSLDEVGELAHAFDNHVIRIRAFIERERAFSVDLGHELRTFLAVIFSAVEMLLEDETLVEKHKKRVARIDRAARDMAEMGTTLLLMAREEHSFATEESSVIADIVEEVVEKHRYLLKSKPIKITVQTDPCLAVSANRGIVFIAISNLIRNAFSYTEQGEISILQDQSSLSICDSGCGIRPHQLDTIFLRHFRDGVSDGAGIGLSLVKRICDRYGWTIRMESRLGLGTTVTLLFRTSS